ncbi:DUF4153 domain-containing protein [Nocardia sp. NPDC051750]|uniref:DUF4153 domain-containing protein n=1 Tax=Nocardia sp. NPDC051750 TaxID=3364325 RepID=UPI00378AAD15
MVSPTEPDAAANSEPGVPRAEPTGAPPTAVDASPSSRAHWQIPAAAGMPEYPNRTFPPPPPPRWQRVAYPAGVLPAAGIAGLVAAATVPLDRPGIGWLLAGSATAAAVTVVHRRARRAANSEWQEPVAPDRTRQEMVEPSQNPPETVAAGRNQHKTAKPSPKQHDTAGPNPKQHDTAGPNPEQHDGAGPSGNPREAAEARPERREAVTAGPTRESLVWAIAALALLAVGTFRAAGWLFVLCVAAAAVAGSLAVVGRRSVHGLFHDVVAVPLASFGAVAWAYTEQGRRRNGGGLRNRRLGVSVAVTVALLAVFVPLLAGADATFAAFVDGLIPRMDGITVTRWIVVFLLAATGSLSAVYLLAGPPTPENAQSKVPNRTLARLEWGLPVGALTLVFALFVGAQLVALFGGDDYVQRTAGLTYAEYARGGFWQLSAVTVLTLAVILPVLHRAARDTAVDRLWLRILLCAISGLTLVMIVSALGRMWTYQQAYGFTVLRLLVGTCELWLGIVYVLVIVAVLRLETAWLPRTTVATAVAALLALAALNPEGLVAAENIDRWQRGEELDIDYLAGLSADIVPAIDRLPAPLRTDLRNRLEYQLDDDTWNSWNLARTRAR